MIKFYSKIKDIVNKIIQTVPHYKFQRKRKIMGLLDDLCFVRSELDIEILNYSNKVENLLIIYKSIVHAIPINQNSIYILLKFQSEINNTSKRVNYLLSENFSTINSIIKLNKYNYIKNSDIETVFFVSRNKIEIINKTFNELSKKITMLDSLETP